MKTTHLVITRFSLNLWGENRCHDEDWLAERIELWDRYFVVGMRHQTRQPDVWVALADPTTPKWVIEHLTGTGVVISSSAPQAVSDVEGRVLSTRIDSDDVLAPDAVERIQAWAATVPDDSVMNFAAGYKLEDGVVYASTNARGPFHSRVERAPAQGVYRLGNHARIHEKRSVDLDMDPAWLVVVHGGNRLNAVLPEDPIVEPPEWVRSLL